VAKARRFAIRPRGGYSTDDGSGKGGWSACGNCGGVYEGGDASRKLQPC